ncbi:MAG: hypothetical protein NPIRA02_04490 [Nitrospirales bacterium]|nr:MAG: hypothetical protein NPIRA02_04490 [Nitrospirales bacterium]
MDYIRALAKKEMADHDVVGMSVALVDDQRVVWSEGFGYADKSNNIKATSDTLYRVGSLSKLFTATAVMQLAEQGKLDIDKPLSTYLPEFRVKTRFADTASVTLRNMLSHHSGLPQNYRKGMMGANLRPFRGLIQNLKDEYMMYPPNLLFSYSYLGFVLSGSVLEAVSGIPYATYMDRMLLQPLGMTRSTFSTITPPPTKWYRKGEEETAPSFRWVPAAGLNSSVLDMSRFLSMVFAGGTAGDRPILQPETLEEMLRPQHAENPLDRKFHVGLGWMLSTLNANTIERAGPVAHHSGGPILFRSKLMILPEQKLGVVVLTNSDTARKVVNTIATETLKLALEVKTGIQQPPVMDVVAGETSFTPEQMQRYVGSYTTLAGFFTIKRDGDSLIAEAMGESAKLYSRTDGRLGVKYRLFGLIPITIEPLASLGFSLESIVGRDLLIVKAGTQERLVGEKFTPVTPSEAWIKRMGEYQLLNRDHDYPLFHTVQAGYENGLLFAEIKLTVGMDRPFRFAIQPISASEAVMLTSLAGMGETLRFVRSENGSKMLEFSGYRFRKIQ